MALEQLHKGPRALPQQSHPSPPPALLAVCPWGSFINPTSPAAVSPCTASLTRTENSCGRRDTYLFQLSIPGPSQAGGLGRSPTLPITGVERSLPGLAKRWPRIVPAAPARDNAACFQGLLPLSPFTASLNVSIIFFFFLFWHFPNKQCYFVASIAAGTDGALFSKHDTHTLKSKGTMAKHIWSALVI